MSLFCIHDKLCENKALTDTLCTNQTTITTMIETVCEKINELVGDPDAECPECPAPVEGGIIAIAQAETVQAKEATARVVASKDAIAAVFAKSSKEPTAETKR